MTAEKAARASIDAAERLRAWEDDYLDRFGDPLRLEMRARVAALVDEEPVDLGVDAWSSELARSDSQGALSVRMLVADAMARRLWHRHRTVYDIDPSLWDVLRRSDHGDDLPPDVFLRLPHPDPYIAFPEPLYVGHHDGVPLRYDGFFTHGLAARAPQPAPESALSSAAGVPAEPLYYPVTTASPLSVALRLVFVGTLVEPGGVTLGPAAGALVTNHVTLTADYKTLGGPVREAGRALGLPVAPGGRAGLDDAAGDSDPNEVRAMITAAVSALVYACVVNADLRPLPASVGTQALRDATRSELCAGDGHVRTKAPKVVGVGYRVGAALRAHVEAIADGMGDDGGTGRSPRPHLRRAHYHTYRVGPGRTGTVLKWLPPIGVKLTGDLAEPTVVRMA